MIFQDLLAKLTQRLGGAQAALLLDKDGISVAEWKRPGSGLDALTVSIEYSRLLLDAGRVAHELGHGKIGELAVKTDRGLLLFTPLDESYFIVLILESDREVGLARYLLRVALPEFRREI
jgi:predicted regulator of Ras-like GTPase activity (Roadblock/LC7/MglB family)